MPLPNVTFVHSNSNLGLPGSVADDVLVVVGPCSLATPNVPVSFGAATPTEVVSALGYGPLANYVAAIVETPGHGTVIALPGTLTAGSFSTVSESGTGAPDLTLSGPPNDEHWVVAKCVKAGTETTARVQISVDKGVTWGDPVSPASAITLGTTGIVATFATGNFELTHGWSARSYAPSISDANIGAAMDALIASDKDFGHIHILTSYKGSSDADNATAFAATFAAVVVKINALQGLPESKPVSCTLDAPAPFANDAAGLVTWQNTLEGATYAGLQHDRMAVCAGFGLVQSPTQPFQQRLPVTSFCVVPRISAAPISEDLGRKRSGPFTIISAEHLESAKPGLDAARFITLRRMDGAIFITNGNMFRTAGSDFRSLQDRRIIDRAERTARSAYSTYLGDTFDADKTTGKLAAYEADTIDAAVTKQLEAALLDPKHASGVYARISREDNVMATNAATAEVGVQRNIYLKYITVKIGLVLKVK